MRLRCSCCLQAAHTLPRDYFTLLFTSVQTCISAGSQPSFSSSPPPLPLSLSRNAPSLDLLKINVCIFNKCGFVWTKAALRLTFVCLCGSAGEQRGGGPGPAGDRDPELGPQTAPPTGHQAAAPGQYSCSHTQMLQEIKPGFVFLLFFKILQN